METQVHTWGTLEKISTHISSHTYMHTRTCTLALFVILFVSLSLQAEIAHRTFINNIGKAPSQHAAPCKGNQGYSVPTGARIGTEENTQAAESAKSARP